MTILEKEAKAILSPEHIGESLSQFGLARHPACLGIEPGKEFIDQWAGLILPDSHTLRGRQTTDFGLDFIEGCDPQQCLVNDR